MASQFSPIPATPEQMDRLSRSLVALGDRLEQEGSDDWFAVALAAAVISGLGAEVMTIQGGLADALASR
ncbi:MAG: hypothetical protein PHD19_11725 [Dechloromonas sp.]|nr:hypothetical protein [Dechloromonas sp.]